MPVDEKLFHRLLELSQQSMSFIDSEDMEGLTATLQEKQVLLDTMLSGNWDNIDEGSKAIIENVLSTDKVAQEVLEKYVGKLRVRVARISTGRNASKGYAWASGR